MNPISSAYDHYAHSDRPVRHSLDPEDAARALSVAKSSQGSTVKGERFLGFSTAFVRTSDGCNFFFPWGLCGRGYVIRSDRGYARLNTWIVVFIALTMSFVYPIASMSGLHVVELMMAVWAFYLVGTQVLLRSMNPPAVRLSLRESFVIQARSHNSDFFLGMTFLVGTVLSGGLFALVFDASDRAFIAPCLMFIGLITAISFAMYRFCVADRRSALLLLAAAKEEGCTEAILQAQGFQQALITGLPADRVAIKSTRPIAVGGRSVEVTRLWITEAGRRELAEPS